MKRTTLFGSVAAGLMAAAVAGPAWAQAATYPEGTDCSAILNDASKMECINQMNESRQNPVQGSFSTPPAGNVAPGSVGGTNGTAPDGSPLDSTTGLGTQANPSGSTSSPGTPSSGATTTP